MSFGLLHEYRIHTTRVQGKIQEAQAFLHNSEAFVRDFADGPDCINKQDLHKLQTMLAHAARALDEVNG